MHDRKLEDPDIAFGGKKITDRVVVRDEWGTAFVVDHYKHPITKENRVEIYFTDNDPEKDEWFIQNDANVDLTFSTFLKFCENFQ